MRRVFARSSGVCRQRLNRAAYPDHPAGGTERALVYVYRQEALAALLAQADVQAFLRAMGYGDASPDGALAFLRQRLAESPCFPHEIGVFLGYPLSDVIAFMRDGGRGCRCSGCWKPVRSDAHFPALQGVPRGIPNAFPRRMAA